MTHGSPKVRKAAGAAAAVIIAGVALAAAGGAFASPAPAPDEPPLTDLQRLNQDAAAGLLDDDGSDQIPTNGDGTVWTGGYPADEAPTEESTIYVLGIED